MEDILERNACQTLQKFSTSLELDLSSVEKLLKAFGMIQKAGNWVSYAFTARQCSTSHVKTIENKTENIEMESLNPLALFSRYYPFGFMRIANIGSTQFILLKNLGHNNFFYNLIRFQDKSHDH